MRRTHILILAGALAAVALALAFYKLVFFGFPVVPGERTDVWRVEVQVRFEATGEPVKAALYLPHGTGGYTVIDQNFVSPGYGITTEPRHGSGIRAVYSIREAKGTQTLYYRAVVQRARPVEATERDPAPAPQPPRYEGAREAAARAIVEAVRRQSADPATLAALVVKRLRDAKPEDEAGYLLGRKPTNARLVATAVELIQAAGVPARIVNGLVLAPERRGAEFDRWIEYHAQGNWRTLHPADPGVDALRHYLPWWRGPGALVEVSGGAGVSHVVTTSRSSELAMNAALAQQRELEKKLIEFSLFGLPLQVQALFRTILVIPLGILLLVVLRNVVGMKTFGTFMPVLIALAFRQTGLLWGCAFFSIVVALGLAVRFYLERLKLLLVPRLASVVIVVIILLAALTVISYKLGFDRGLSIGLFPIVILTMTIERMTVVWEERGAGEALQQAAGSIAVGALCYLLMNVPTVEHLFFVFPELLLIVLAATLLLGRYTGYRLSELRRFRVLAK